MRYVFMPDVIPASRSAIPRIVRALKRGAVIVYPTDTVYGLGCAATKTAAILRTLRMKKRKEKPFPLLVSGLGMGEKYAVINDAQKRMLQQLWPGAVTAVLPAKKHLEKISLEPYRNIGLRSPKHTFLLSLLSSLKCPLIGTSANQAGEPAARTFVQAIAAFTENPEGLKPDFFIDGGTLPGRSSTVVDLTGYEPRILRRGPIRKAAIMAMWRKIQQ